VSANYLLRRIAALFNEKDGTDDGKRMASNWEVILTPFLTLKPSMGFIWLTQIKNAVTAYANTRFNVFLKVHSGSFQNLISSSDGIRERLDVFFGMWLEGAL